MVDKPNVSEPLNQFDIAVLRMAANQPDAQTIFDQAVAASALQSTVKLVKTGVLVADDETKIVTDLGKQYLAWIDSLSD